MRPLSSIRDHEDANCPKVAIFWLVAGRMIFDSTLVSRAENYASCTTHSRYHEERWEQLTRSGAIAEGDYEEHPRGRIVYDTKSSRFTIYADRCIVKKNAVVGKIMREMSLPANTKISTDPTIAVSSAYRTILPNNGCQFWNCKTSREDYASRGLCESKYHEWPESRDAIGRVA